MTSCSLKEQVYPEKKIVWFEIDFSYMSMIRTKREKEEYIAKGTADPRVEFISQVAHKS